MRKTWTKHTLPTSHIFNVLSSDAVTNSLLSLDHATSEMPWRSHANRSNFTKSIQQQLVMHESRRPSIVTRWPNGWDSWACAYNHLLSFMAAHILKFNAGAKMCLKALNLYKSAVSTCECKTTDISAAVLTWIRSVKDCEADKTTTTSITCYTLTHWYNIHSTSW